MQDEVTHFVDAHYDMMYSWLFVELIMLKWWVWLWMTAF